MRPRTWAVPATALLVLALVAVALTVVGLARRGDPPAPSAVPSGTGPATSTTADGSPAVPAPSATTPSVTPPSATAPSGTGRSARPSRPARAAPPAPTATSSVCVPQGESRRLTVLTFNIHSARTPDGRVRLDTIAAELARWRADVVLLQEVDRGRQWTGRVDMPAVLAERLGMSWVFGANVRRSPTNLYGTAILSRHPVTDSRNILLPAPPGTQQRGLLSATVDLDGVPVSVYGTHLEHTSREARTRQMQAIAPVLRADPHPLVFGGDLNSVVGSPALAIARGFLGDTWAAVGTGPGHTAPGRSPRLRIDHLLYDDGSGADLEPLSAVVLRSAVSDHRAVRATYEVTTDRGEVCLPELSGPVGG